MTDTSNAVAIDDLHTITVQTVAQTIVQQHAATFAGFDALPAPPQPASSPSALHSVYAGALQACSALGFIAADALCLAGAWQAQTQRLGVWDASQWPCTPQDFGMGTNTLAKAADGANGAGFSPCPHALGLYAVLPDAQWVGRMARAGVPTVQLRFKCDDAAAIEREIAHAVAQVQGTPALLFINDHWEQAIAAGAYGIHLGQEDLDALAPEQLRRLQASGLRLGVSTHGYAEMVRADALRPSYIAMGAVFPTTLKKMATAPQGLGRLGMYAQLMRQYPQVAIGGISAEQFAPVLATGVGSIAVVRALVNAPDPQAEAERLMACMRAAVPQSPH